MPQEYGKDVWYAICITAEIFTLLTCVVFRSTVSIPVGLLSIFLIAVHILGYSFNGGLSDSPYHYSVLTIEYTELVACILFSPTLIGCFKRKIK